LLVGFEGSTPLKTLPFIECAAQKPALFPGGKKCFPPPMTRNDTQGFFRTPLKFFFEKLLKAGSV
jgi:hypothetical protein